MSGYPVASSSEKPSALELWAGPECTVNRVGDTVFDQLERTGHASRLNDLDLFAELGIRAIRYPILWERIAPHTRADADWAWADERLGRLRDLGIRPIVGLVHHGSGPPHTSLLDPQFPAKLAAYAGAVAARFPWIETYIPINEPLTTARFSGLYGHWHPHGRDMVTCIRLLLTQCRAVALAMAAIRDVNPSARLLLNDDVGKVFATPVLAYQAEHENERRWLAFDLLGGRVDRTHPLWTFLLASGATEDELAWFAAHPCPPDILGFDYYPNSDRFLDEHLDRYPPEWHSGNGEQVYANLPAAHVRAGGIAGTRALLNEMWARYERPIVIGEVHHAGFREKQLRWFHQSWQAGEKARRDGADVRAVTAWALVGMFDWHILCTRIAGLYEPGVFDLRSSRPRPTALAGLLRQCADGREHDHPLLDVAGWWRRPVRFIFGHAVDDGGYYQAVDPAADTQPAGSVPAGRSLLIAGGEGPLGRTFARICRSEGIPYHILAPAADQAAGHWDRRSLEEAVEHLRPWAVADAAGCDAPRLTEALAGVCARSGVRLLTFSSDRVFDGSGGPPATESDDVSPFGEAGRQQAAVEKAVATKLPFALIVRTGPLFGLDDEHDFVAAAVRTLLAGDTVLAAGDQVVSPVLIDDLVEVGIDLLADGESGVWHLTTGDHLTWAALARRLAALTGVSQHRVRDCPASELGADGHRPAFSALGSERGALRPRLDDSLDRYVASHTARLPAVLVAL